MKLFYFKYVPWKGKKIRIVKFRTMKPDSYKEKDDLIKSNGIDGLGKVINDPRITSIGKLLRKYWIDELPQLFWNICIKQNMCLVGLRPQSEEEWKSYPEDIRKKQSRYRYGLISPTYTIRKKNFEENIRINREYLNNREKNRWRTDIECFFRVMNNIIFKGMRSR